MYKVGVIGAGKVGVSLSRYFFSNSDRTCDTHCSQQKKQSDSEDVYAGNLENYIFQGFYSKSFHSAQNAAEVTGSEVYDAVENLVEKCDVLFITTPDDEIKTVWGEISSFFIENKIICHCSGSLSSEVFFGAEEKGAKVCSLHPLLAISNKAESYMDLKDAFFSLEGDEYAIAFFSELLDRRGNRYKILSQQDKTKYHVASVFMSNLIIGMYQMASELLESYGFSEDDVLQGFKTLATGNMSGLMEKGARESLTGPAERCDIGTITKHLNTLSNDGYKDIETVYRLLTLEIIKTAKEKNPERDYTQLERVLLKK
ncbi:MAG: DUF2520 domain-containing protein [Hornefia sp.]|nr:DUF2520 domain-containing protein [Hornefia sp.]